MRREYGNKLSWLEKKDVLTAVVYRYPYILLLLSLNDGGGWMIFIFLIFAQFTSFFYCLFLLYFDWVVISNQIKIIISIICWYFEIEQHLTLYFHITISRIGDKTRIFLQIFLNSIGPLTKLSSYQQFIRWMR